MKNKVDRRDLSQLRNEVDLLSLPLDRCEMAVDGESAFAFFRIEVQIGCAVAVAVEFIDLLVEIQAGLHQRGFSRAGMSEYRYVAYLAGKIIFHSSIFPLISECP